MKKQITLVNEKNQERVVKDGFSFTIFLFGPLALFVRGQFLLGAIYLLITYISPHIISGEFNLALIYGIVLAFIGNKLLVQSLIKSGYQVRGKLES